MLYRQPKRPNQPVKHLISLVTLKKTTQPTIHLTLTLKHWRCGGIHCSSAHDRCSL